MLWSSPLTVCLYAALMTCAVVDGGDVTAEMSTPGENELATTGGYTDATYSHSELTTGLPNFKTSLQCMLYGLKNQWDREKRYCLCFKICADTSEEEIRQVYNSLKEAAQQSNKVEFITRGTIFCIICVTGILGNVLVLVTVSFHMPRESVTNIFISSLAVADLLVVGFCVPFQAYFVFHMFWFLGDILCKAVLYAFFSAFMCSVFTLVGMSFERYMAICYPMKAQYMSTPSRARKTVVAIWFVSFVLGIPTLLMAGDQLNTCRILRAERLYNLLFAVYLAGVVFLVPVCVMTYTYARVSVTLWQSVKEVRQMQNKPTAAKGEAPKKKDDTAGRVQVVKMLVSVLCIFVVCWGPFLTMYVLRVALPARIVDADAFGISWTVTQTLSYINSCVNPILYAFMSRQFRKGFRRCFSRCCPSLAVKETTSSGVTASTAVTRGVSTVSA